MKILKYLDEHLEEIILCVFLAIITCCTCLQCFMRYAMHHALSWTDELSKYCFVFSGFISIGYSIRKGLAIRIDIIRNALPAKVFALLNVLVSILMLTLFVLLFQASLVTYRSFLEGKMVSTVMGIPMHYIYAGAIAGFVIAIFRSVESLILRDLPLCFGRKPKL